MSDAKQKPKTEQKPRIEKKYVNQANMTNTTLYRCKLDRDGMYRCLDGETVEHLDRGQGKWVPIDRSESVYYSKEIIYREY